MKQKNRICIIADYIDEQYAGIYTYARELITELVRLDTDNEYTFLHCRKNAFFDGQREIIVPLKRFIPGVPSFRKFVWIPHILQKQHFDLVHDLSHIAPFAFARFPGKKVITIHDLTPVLFPQFHVWNSAVVHKIMFPQVFKKADAVIAVSENTKKDIIHKYHPPAPVFVTPLGTRDLSLPPSPSTPPAPSPLFSNPSASTSAPLTAGFNKGDNYILFVSTLEPRKNVETLIKAYNLIRDRGRTEKLVLIGKKGWKSEGIFHTLNESRYKEDIRSHDYIAENELGKYFQNASVFVYPSHYEGFGLPILEAMRFGVPVVAANNSSIPEVVGNAGLLFETKNVEDLAAKLYDLLENKQLRAELGHKGLKQVQKFTWENTARKTVEVYRQVLESGVMQQGQSKI